MDKTKIPSDRVSKPEDSAPSLPENSVEEIVFSQKTRTPLFIKGGILMGILAGTAISGTYLLNNAYNNDEVYLRAPGVTEYRKVDGAYANTILIKGDTRYGRSYVKVERNTWNNSRIYIGYQGCSSVDEIILQEGPLGTGEALVYEREKYGELKSGMFVKADREMKEQCARFKPMMKLYFPNRRSR